MSSTQTNNKDLYKNIYEPQEDSYLLLKHTLNYLDNNFNKKKQTLDICEVGIGSGFVISNIAQKYNLHNYYGTDINKFAIDMTTQKFSKNKINIKLKKTNLLSKLNHKFDIILFNTPYLPLEKKEKYENLSLKDKAIYGGKKGYEIIEEFIYQVGDKLKQEGIAIIIFSSYSNLKYIENLLLQNLYDFKILETQRFFFENIYALKFQKSKKLIEIENNNITNIKYYTSGKHSKIFKGNYKKQDIIIKLGKFEHIQIEEIFLKKFQKENFVPKYVTSTKDFIIMEEIKGITIKNFLKKEQDKNKIIKIFDRILLITKKLDEYKINKFELINPRKHIIIQSNLEVKFIDFERTLYTNNPKNITQILQYIQRNINLLKKKAIFIDKNKILQISKQYKNNNFKFQLKDLY
ncbi:MAG: HemK2/MTQ2 family protein methyltransferase [Nanoarchaeota archaeon]